VSVDQLEDYRGLNAALRASARDLLTTPTAMARGLDPRYVVRPYARVIGAAMAELLAGQTFKRLMIVLPTQIGKSTLVNEWGSLWWLANRPEDRIISTSYSDDLAKSRGERVAGLVAEHGYLYDLHHRRSRPSAKQWSLTTGGGMRSVAMGRSITGFPANVLIIDDPFKDRFDAESHARREHVWDWYSSTGSQRLQPSSPIIVINTRWHVEDLSGRLLTRDGLWEDGGKWRLLHFAAEADPKFGPDPLGRRAGEWLPHHGIKMIDLAGLDLYWRDKRSEQTPRDWASMAQGDPQPVTGALVTYDLLRSIREYAPGKWAPAIKHAIAIDPSGGGRDAAGVVGGHLGADGRLWITHDRSGVGGSDEWSAWACELAVELGADTFIIEKNFGGDMAARMIKTTWEKLGRDHETRQAEQAAAALAAGVPFTPTPNPYPMHGIPSIVEVTAKKSKVLRGELVAQQMKQDKARIGAPMHELEQEWATWMPTDSMSPGRIDASVYLAWHLLKIGAMSEVLSVAGTKVSSGGTGGGQVGGRKIQRR
jgi:hypothetical protein